MILTNTFEEMEGDAMNLPKMIIFDYGQTLLQEPGLNSLSGEEALFRFVKSNRHNLTPRQINDAAQELFAQLGDIRRLGYELHERQFQKLLHEYLEIELTIPLAEAEQVYWDHTSAGAIMPDADKVLSYLQENGIRSGVISNIMYSGEALAARCDRLLPGNQFEFIIASSEYLFRKPHRYLFELALKKAQLPASDVWFCGDNVIADVAGASAVGIYPVWYECASVPDPFAAGKTKDLPTVPHLHIREWNELILVLEQLNGN